MFILVGFDKSDWVKLIRLSKLLFLQVAGWVAGRVAGAKATQFSLGLAISMEPGVRKMEMKMY